jgi:hypothetical protein
MTHWRNYWQAFLDGATQPSLPVLGGTLGVAVTIFGLMLTLLTPDLLATKGYGYFLTDPSDDYAYLTSETLRIRKEAPSRASVALIGDSFFQEALHPKYLERELQDQTHQPITVYKLAVGGLFLWEEICILDNIRHQFQGVIVLHVQPPLLSQGREHLKGGITRHSRLALYCSAFDAEMQLAGISPPKWTGNYFIDHYKFFVARLPALLKNLITGPVPWSDHNAEQWRPPTKQQWDRAVNSLVRWQKDYRRNREANFGVYARLLQLLRSSGKIQVVLVETTINPRAYSLITAIPDTKRFYEEYQTDMNRFAQEQNVPYWDIGTVANLLHTEDFIDHIHIKSPQARKRYAAELARRLTEVLRSAVQ